MPETTVTVLRCTTCGTSRLKQKGERYWCATCGDWRGARAARLDATAAWHNFGLQPLRIPQGWRVAYNSGLYEIDPDPALIPEDERWWVFKADMLQLRHDAANRLLDVGWHPEGDLVNGAYHLVLLAGSFSDPELERLSTRSRQRLVRELERIMARIA